MKETVFEIAVSLLPRDAGERISEYLHKTRTPVERVNEIRLRASGPLALVVSGKNVSLGATSSKDELREAFKRVCGGAVFLHRDDMCRGFVSLSGGLRVGVCAEARYEKGEIVGIGEVSALVFRLPCGECSFATELYRQWRRHGEGGMLICSAAGEGKTSAIRALSALIGSGEYARRVVVVDERCEFDPSAYRSSHVDILRGYRRASGVDIAIRTMSCEVLVVDEISSREDSRAMISAIGAGVTVIATAHARSFSEVVKREYVRELVDAGLFNTVCVISRNAGRFAFSVERIE